MVSRAFYLLILVSFITIYKRFVFPESFVSGTANIYLTPKIYLIDPFLVLLFVFEVWYFWLSGGINRARVFIKNNLTLFLFPLALLASVLLSTPMITSATTLIRFCFFLPLIFFILSSQFNYRKMVWCLTLPVVVVSIFALLQWYNQHYVFGFFPFGEPLFSSSSANAPLVDYFGFLRLRAFGTFPHPNVLGGFLSISLLLILDLIRFTKSQGGIKSLYLFSVFLLGLTALYFSFSQGAWGSLILGSGALALWRLSKVGPSFKNRILIIFLTAILLGVFWLIYRLPLDGLNTHRTDLANVSLRLFSNRPFLGVGFGNFVKYSPYYWKEPVHNIYLLLLSETGVLGLVALLVLLLQAFTKAFRKALIFPAPLLILSQVLFLGLFDHYLITSATGNFILWLVLGLSLRHEAWER